MDDGGAALPAPLHPLLGSFAADVLLAQVSSANWPYLVLGGDAGMVGADHPEML